VRVTVAMLAVASLAACSSAKPEPVPALRAPKTVDEVTGIWRTVHQNTLELRKKGTFVLITSVSRALAGDFSLEHDRMSVFNTSECGNAEGTYRVEVAPQNRLVFSEPQDACTLRRTQLTADTYVYAS
jgi:type IV secretory pathway protease TraF